MKRFLSRGAAGAVACALAGLSAGEAHALSWSSEVVDPAPMHVAGIESSLAIDASGRPNIVYREQIGGDLKFARRSSSGAWSIEFVDTLLSAGHGASLALDASGQPNVLYFRNPDSINLGDLVFAKRSCLIGDIFCSWTRTTLATKVHSPSLLGNTAITIDHDGNIQGAFVDVARGLLVYVRRDSAGWSLNTVTPVGSGAVSIAVDVNNLPRIAFSDGTTTQRYAQVTCVFILCGWTIETIDAGTGGTVRLDGSGRVSVGYLRGSDVRFARRSCDSSGGNCAWATELVAAGAGVTASPSLAVSASNAAHMAFYSVSNSEVRYARRGLFGWTTERADLLGSFFGTLSIVLDAQGNPSISHFDDFNDDLRFAHGIPIPPPVFDPGLPVLDPGLPVRSP